MSEQTVDSTEQLEEVNLHQQPGLQEVQVRDGVVLRPMQDDDAVDLLTILAADPSIRDRVSVASKMRTVEDVKHQVAEYKADDSVIRYVILSDDACVGLVSFWRDGDFFPGRTGKPHTFGFGYFLDPTQRGKGLINDSVNALMSQAQANFRVDSFIAFCEPDNQDSIAVLHKIGFEQTDELHTEPSNGWQEVLYEKRVVNV